MHLKNYRNSLSNKHNHPRMKVPHHNPTLIVTAFVILYPCDAGNVDETMEKMQMIIFQIPPKLRKFVLHNNKLCLCWQFHKIRLRICYEQPTRSNLSEVLRWEIPSLWKQINEKLNVSMVWVTGHSPTLCLFFIKWQDVLPPNLAKTWSREIGCYNHRMAQKFDKHLGNGAAEVPVKF